MALPPGMTTANVTAGPVLGFDGAECSLVLTITASTTLLWAATGASLAPFPMSAPPGAQASMPLPHCDQEGFVNSAGLAVTDWHYIAAGSWIHPDPDVPRISFRKPFRVLVGQGDVDLDTVPLGPVTAPTTAPAALVTSIGGFSGAVTAEQIESLGRLHVGPTPPEDTSKVWIPTPA